MKAIFVGGEYHGKTTQIDSPRRTIWLLGKFGQPTATYWVEEGNPVEYKPINPIVYDLETELIHATQYGQETFAIYRNGDDATTWKEFNRLYLLSLGAGVIGINRWLDEQMECRLAYDAELRRKLWTASVAFEFAIREIESRNAESRLKRRFPETFTT